MPLLDFICKECGHQFFLLISNRERDQVRCPACKSEQVKQTFAGTAYFKTSANGKDSCGTSRFG